MSWHYPDIEPERETKDIAKDFLSNILEHEKTFVHQLFSLFLFDV